MVVRDESFLGATDTFAVEQGASMEAAEDLNKDIIHEASQCVPLVGGLLHFVSVHAVG
jgi:DNA-binding transcriptional regulator LsrR (DeoR family)